MSFSVSVINIGNELLLGRTINTNLSWLGTHLADLGLPITRSIVIQDNPEYIRSTLASEWKENDIVIVTGGLGPTEDDLTKQIIADYFEKELTFRLDIWQNVQTVFERRGLRTPLINRSQAMVPEGFLALINRVGTAPGLHYTENHKHFFALPGVPIEMKTLFTDCIADILKNAFPVTPIYIKNIHTWNISESALAEKLNKLHVPEGLSMAWLPQTGRVDLRLYGNDLNIVNKFAEIISRDAQEWIWGTDDDKPQTVLHKLMKERDYTLSIAESCTGGLVQELLTTVPGSSSYFVGGVISYSNDLKIKILNVNPKTIKLFGAVSEETAKEMAVGIRKLTKSDISIAITGIAGPDGGLEDKPVGTVCFAISANSDIFTTTQVFNGDRQSIRWKAAEYIILLLIKKIRSSS